MLILPRSIQAPCLLRRGMPTIFLHLGKFQPAKWGIFNRRKLGNIQPALTTSGLFDKWVADCPLSYTSGNAPEKRDVLGTLLLSVLSGHWRYAHINAIRGDGINPWLLTVVAGRGCWPGLLAGVAGNDGGGKRGLGAAGHEGNGRGRQRRVAEKTFEGQLRAAAGRAVGVRCGHHGEAVVRTPARRQGGIQPPPISKAVRHTLITVTSWRISGWCWTWRCKRAIRRRRHLRNRNCGRFWTDSRSGAGPYFCAGTAIGERRKPWLEPRSEGLGTCSNSSRARM